MESLFSIWQDLAAGSGRCAADWRRMAKSLAEGGMDPAMIAAIEAEAAETPVPAVLKRVARHLRDEAAAVEEFRQAWMKATRGDRK
jgi:hypothetical protein